VHVDIMMVLVMLHLYIAAKFGFAEIVRDLINAGAPVDARAGNGMLFVLCYFFLIYRLIFLPIFDSLLLFYYFILGTTPLFLATEASALSVMELLLSCGADPNVSESGGDTPIIVARNGNIARLLILKGARVNYQNRNGDTALHNASSLGYIDVVSVLLSAGADVTLRNKYSETAIDIVNKSKQGCADLRCADELLELLLRNIAVKNIFHM
jgi:ankyrin repeat protein